MTPRRFLVDTTTYCVHSNGEIFIYTYVPLPRPSMSFGMGYSSSCCASQHVIIVVVQVLSEKCSWRKIVRPGANFSG